MPLLKRFADTFLEILFPPHCLLCSSALPDTLRSTFLCGVCRAALPMHSALFCAECRARLPDARRICHRDAPYLLGAAADYSDPSIRELVWQLKYRRLRAAAEPLAEHLARYVAGLPLDLNGALWIPIPLHPRREQNRGFNQAALMLDALCRRMPLMTVHALVRVRHTPPQVETKGAESRAKNVAGCFAVPQPGLVSGRTIVLLDDVSTSGATLAEASRALKAAGAKRVIGLVAAKA